MQWLFIPLFVVLSSNAYGEDECILACRQYVHVAVGNECNLTVTPELVLQAPDVTCPGEKLLQVYTLEGLYLDSSPFVPSTYLGDTLEVKVTDVASQNFCWASIILTDTQNPVFVSSEDLYLDCSVVDMTPDNPLIDYPVFEDNCQNTLTLTYEDTFVSLGCTDPTYGDAYVGYYLREWLAEDDYSNAINHTQTIFIIRNQVEDVVYPINYDGFGLPMMDCMNADTSVTNTGYPTISGNPVSSNCEMSIYYSDQIIDLCGGGYKVYRTWEVYEWCDNDVNYHVQVIIVQDNQTPSVDCGADVLDIEAANVNNCAGEITVPNLIVSGGCSNNYLFEVTMANDPMVYAVGDVISYVSIGTHVLNYTISNDCGALSTCDKNINVTESNAPLVSCAIIDVISLDSDGQASLTALELDGGSTDDCNISSYQIRYKNLDDCVANTDFSSTLSFDCCMSNTFVEVELKVTDDYGNEALCTRSIFIQDDITPTLNCPADVSINCTQDPADLNLVGVATTSDNCSSIDLEYTDINIQINSCGSGSIQRLWMVNDAAGNADSCIQVITIVNGSPFDENDIIWPQNFTTNVCGTSLDVNTFNFPYVPMVSQGDCDDVTMSSQDEIIYYHYEGDQSIQRTWTVINSCSSPGNQNIWTHTQILTITDDQSPVVTCPSSEIYGDINANCDEVYVSINDISVTDCDDNLEYVFEIDFQNNQSIDLTVNSSEVAHWLPVGIHTVYLTVTDSKGNETVCEWSITCRDLILPVVMAIPSLTMDMSERDADGVLRIYSYMFDAGSYDNCTEYDNMYKLIFPSSFTCSNVGENEVTYTVIDGAGNLDQVVTSFLITDNDNICNLEKTLTGTCFSPMDEIIPDVNVEIQDQNILTDENGTYNYFYFDVPTQLTVTPTKIDMVRDGVNTFDLIKIGRHVLETEYFTDPYQFVAADVNDSKSITGADVVILRQLLLFNMDVLPQVNSWRFISDDFVFPPFTSIIPDFPESVDVENPSNPVNEENFVGIKMGDVDFSYVNLAQNPLSTRNALNIDLNIVENAQGTFDVFTSKQTSLASFQMINDVENAQMSMSPNLEGEFFQANKANQWTALYYNISGDEINANEKLFTLNFNPSTHNESMFFEWFDNDGQRYNLNWILENNKRDIFSVYPTLIEDITTVDFKSINPNATLNIVNAEGKVVNIINAVTHSQRIDLSNLPLGIYFLQLHINGSVYTQKVVKV